MYHTHRRENRREHNILQLRDNRRRREYESGCRPPPQLRRHTSRCHYHLRLNYLINFVNNNIFINNIIISLFRTARNEIHYYH